MRRLAVSLFGFMGMATGLEAHEFSDVCEDGVLNFRMNYYPPCPQPDQVIGCSPHTDITIKPVPDAVDVIIGHITAIMSNGVYEATEHRAVVNESKELISSLSMTHSMNINNPRRFAGEYSPNGMMIPYAI
ncbi:hypothetical protein AAC387_Pa05g2124 [Persea americana]